MSGFSINEYEFNDLGKVAIGKEKKGKDWTVVYLIHNDNYILARLKMLITEWNNI